VDLILGMRLLVNLSAILRDKYGDSVNPETKDSSSACWIPCRIIRIKRFQGDIDVVTGSIALRLRFINGAELDSIWPNKYLKVNTNTNVPHNAENKSTIRSTSRNVESDVNVSQDKALVALFGVASDDEEDNDEKDYFITDSYMKVNAECESYEAFRTFEKVPYIQPIDHNAMTLRSTHKPLRKIDERKEPEIFDVIDYDIHDNQKSIAEKMGKNTYMETVLLSTGHQIPTEVLSDVENHFESQSTSNVKFFFLPTKEIIEENGKI
jgi:hypothetical protein